uniref:PH01B031C15.6 protein n=1 Tax=Phyllostachys edulis TaxID=38705 RepID=L0P3X4_PHYED|nr:PH01B031C15.6 [Phyllostachys edulis]
MEGGASEVATGIGAKEVGGKVEGDGVVVVTRSGLSGRDGGGGFEFGFTGEERGWWRNSRVLPDLGKRGWFGGV